MSKAHCAAFLVTLISVMIPLILLSLEADAQSTVDDSASCESSTLVEAVNLIREDLKDVRLIRDDVKNLLESRQQTLSSLNSPHLCE